MTSGVASEREEINHVRGKRAVGRGENLAFSEDEAIKKLDEVISTYSDSDNGYDDESLEDSSDTSSIKVADTNSVGSEVVSQFKPIVSEIIQDELHDIEKELQSQGLKEEEEVKAVEDILEEDAATSNLKQASISGDQHQEELAEMARITARAREDLRFGSKAVSRQIRHRLLTREIGSIAAVSAGDGGARSKSQL